MGKCSQNTTQPKSNLRARGLHGKRALAGVTKVRDLRWGGHPAMTRWPILPSHPQEWFRDALGGLYPLLMALEVGVEGLQGDEQGRLHTPGTPTGKWGPLSSHCRERKSATMQTSRRQTARSHLQRSTALPTPWFESGDGHTRLLTRDLYRNKFGYSESLRIIEKNRKWIQWWMSTQKFYRSFWRQGRYSHSKFSI